MNKLILKLYLALFIFLNFNEVNAQVADSNFEKVEKNILSYNIRYHFEYENCSNYYDYHLDNCFPKENEELDIDFLPLLNLKYPKDYVKLLWIHNNFNLFREIGSDRREVKFFSHGIPNDEVLSKRILIGIHEDNNEIIYISGNVFKSCIANDFILKIDNPLSFTNFLELKLFNYDVERITFKKRRRKYLLFTAYSKTIKEEVYIKVNPIDFDLLQVKGIKSDWTENGSYKWTKNKRCD